MSYYVTICRIMLSKFTKSSHTHLSQRMSDTLLPTFVLRGHAAEVATIELDSTNSKLLSGFVLFPMFSHQSVFIILKILCALTQFCRWSIATVGFAHEKMHFRGIASCSLWHHESLVLERSDFDVRFVFWSKSINFLQTLSLFVCSFQTRS